MICRGNLQIVAGALIRVHRYDAGTFPHFGTFATVDAALAALDDFGRENLESVREDVERVQRQSREAVIS